VKVVPSIPVGALVAQMSSTLTADRDLQAPGQRSATSANFKFALPPPPPYTPLRLGQIAPAAPTKRTPKIRLNLPKETVVVLAADGRLRSTRSHFARTPIPPRLVPPQKPVPPPDVITTEIYPPDSLRVEIPNSIDVFLPGQVSVPWTLIPSVAISDVFSSVRLGCGEEKVHG
jgi:hypothetical protein